ncbi:MAG: efflux RND transporter periplasmic adaptor subunit [Acidobacteriota bacterium]|nr:efflux RND transporter periplasmic adaptor subunit [Acidobacteriota bacterium]
MTIFRETSTDTDTRVWWRERRFLGIAGAIVLLLVIFLLWRSCHAATPAGETNVEVSVQVAKAERGTIAREVTAVATLAAQREATISPKVAAQIAQMPLLTNRRVRAGDVLVVLEARDLAAQRAEAASAVTEAETTAHSTVNGAIPITNAQDTKAVRDARANLDTQEKTYERRKVLFEQGGISKKDLESSALTVTQAQDDLRVAEASASAHHAVTNPGDIQVAQSRAQQARDRLKNLDAQLSYTVLRAPFDGVITGQFQYQGDLAAAGAKLVTIADATNLIAKTQIAEEIASALKPGDAVKIIPEDQTLQPLDGAISLVGHGADPQSRSVEVWARIPNPTGLLRPNGVARMVIAAQSVSNAVIVPAPAVTLDATNGNSGTVMVVDNKSIAHEVHVTIGVRTADRMQILSGLQGGETVVTEGNYGLPDGTKVTVASDKGAPAK